MDELCTLSAPGKKGRTTGSYGYTVKENKAGWLSYSASRLYDESVRSDLANWTEIIDEMAKATGKAKRSPNAVRNHFNQMIREVEKATSEFSVTDPDIRLPEKYVSAASSDSEVERDDNGKIRRKSYYDSEIKNDAKALFKGSSLRNTVLVAIQRHSQQHLDIHRLLVRASQII